MQIQMRFGCVLGVRWTGNGGAAQPPPYYIKKGIHKTQLKNNTELKPLLEQYPPTFAQNELKL